MEAIKRTQGRPPVARSSSRSERAESDSGRTVATQSSHGSAAGSGSRTVEGMTHVKALVPLVAEVQGRENQQLEHGRCSR